MRLCEDVKVAVVAQVQRGEIAECPERGPVDAGQPAAPHDDSSSVGWEKERKYLSEAGRTTGAAASHPCAPLFGRTDGHVGLAVAHRAGRQPLAVGIVALVVHALDTGVGAKYNPTPPVVHHTIAPDAGDTIGLYVKTVLLVAGGVCSNAGHAHKVVVDGDVAGDNMLNDDAGSVVEANSVVGHAAAGHGAGTDVNAVASVSKGRGGYRSAAVFEQPDQASCDGGAGSVEQNAVTQIRPDDRVAYFAASGRGAEPDAVLGVRDLSSVACHANRTVCYCRFGRLRAYASVAAHPDDGV